MVDLMEDAVSWLVDCFPDDEEEILVLMDEDIRRAVQRYYEGGWAAFEENTV